MPRRKTSQTRTPKNVGPLMVVDQKPFLKKALARCQRIRRDLAKRQKDLAAFEEVDQAAYETWLASTFGALLTQLRESRDALFELSDWLDHVEFSQVVIGVSHNEVYEYVRKHREDPDYWDPRYDSDPKEIEEETQSAADEFDDMDDDERNVFEDFIKNMAEGVFGIDAEDLEDDPDFPGWLPGGERQKPAPREASAAEKREKSELKQLYRRLARRLHPDVRRSEGPEADRRWEQLQTAYNSKNIEELRALEAVCDADETGLSIKLGLAHLNTWADYHQLLLKPLQVAVREAKKHPAWGFTRLDEKQITRREKEVKEELKREIELIESRCHYLQTQLDSYRRMARKKAPRSATKRPKKKPKSPQNSQQAKGPNKKTRSPIQSEFPF